MASGQNCFRTLWFSGADPSWAARRFHQGSRSFVVFLALSGSVLGQKVLWKVPRFHQGHIFGIFGLLGRIPFVPKICVKRVPHDLFTGGFRLPKVPVFVFPKLLRSSQSLPGLLGSMVDASEKVLWRVPPTLLYIFLPVSWGQSCVNWWHVSTIQIQSPENDPSCLCCWGILWAYDSFWRVSSHGFLKGSWGSDFSNDLWVNAQVQFNRARGAHGTVEGPSAWQGTGSGCVAPVGFLDVQAPEAVMIHSTFYRGCRYRTYNTRSSQYIMWGTICTMIRRKPSEDFRCLLW